MASFSILLSVVSLCVSALIAQKRHYGQINMLKDWKDNDALNAVLIDKLKELDDLKKRVDLLTFKSGMKI